MNRAPVSDWQQLSALYEAADALAPPELAAWLAELRAQPHPLLAQLEQMLAARAKIQSNDFLGTPPTLPVRTAPPNLPDPEPAWAEGSRIGPYRLIRRLGAGGMAEVWMAQRDDGAFQRTVAIKLLFRHAGSSERDALAQRFTRERDILASLDHPNIAGLHDAGVTPAGQPWLALEYVEGDTLTHWCDAQRLDIAARVRLFRQVLLAVQHAHANLVIHRDLKPGNILVTAQGEVRLLDFGIAKLVETEGGALAETELTRMAGRPMTPQYAAPEQLLGQPLTTACDVYSLGVVLYQLLCGERPYELKLDSAAQLEQSILEVEPRGPSRRALTESVVEARGTSAALLHKTLASDLDAIVLRALAKQPAKRYASAEAFRADLDRWLDGEPVEARVPSAAYRVSKFVRRHKWGVGLSGLAVVALIATTAVAVVMGLQAREDSARAGAARDFMLGLFKRADQEKARGADVTARELLETGRKDVLTRMMTQPRLQAELLQGIGDIQKDMGEYAGADSTFADAARTYARLGLQRRAALAKSEEANAAMRMGDMKLAQVVVEQARDISGAYAADPEVNARLHEVEGWIAVAAGDGARARELFGRSYEEALAAFGPNHLRTIDVLRGRIYAERLLRNLDESLRLFGLAETALAKAADVSGVDFAAFGRDRSDLQLAAGHFSASLNAAEAALSKCNSDIGPNHKMCRELLFSKVNLMLQMGMTTRAAEELPSLLAVAADVTSPALSTGTLLLILKLSSVAGLAEVHSATFERVVKLLEPSSGVVLTPSLRGKAYLALAESRLRADDPIDAQRWVAKAVALQRRGDGLLPTSRLGALAKSLQGVVFLQQGKANEALQSLLDGQADLSKMFGPEDPVTCMYSLNVALAFEALNRRSDALAIVDRAELILRKAMGADAPLYLRVRELQNRLGQLTSIGSTQPPIERATVVRDAWDFFS